MFNLSYIAIAECVVYLVTCSTVGYKCTSEYSIFKVPDFGVIESNIVSQCLTCVEYEFIVVPFPPNLRENCPYGPVHYLNEFVQAPYFLHFHRTTEPF